MYRFMELDNSTLMQIDDFFKKDIVREKAPGTGKTWTLANVALKHLIDVSNKKTNDILIITTMSNTLLYGLLKEFTNTLKIQADKHNCYELFEPVVDNIDNDIDVYSSCLKLGVLLYNRYHSFNVDRLKYVNVIFTNHSYFFPQGHGSKYLKSIEDIQEYFKDRKFKIYFDEFDQFHKYGNTKIPMNNYIRNNFTDRYNSQKEIATSCLQYCTDDDFILNQNELEKKNTSNDFTFEVPDINYRYEYKRNKYKSNEYKGTLKASSNFDFKSHFIDNVKIISEIKYNKPKYSKLITENYRFKFINCIEKILPNDSIYSEEKMTHYEKFLLKSKILLFSEMKIELYENIKTEKGNIEGSAIKIFENRNEFVSWCKLNIDKETYILFKKFVDMNKRELYIKNLISHKNCFEFDKSEKYYTTATPGPLEQMGYSIDDSGKYDKNNKNKIEILDIFIIQNKQATINEISKFAQISKKYKDIYSLGIVNKKDSVKEFINTSRNNTKLNNTECVYEDQVISFEKMEDIKKPMKNFKVSYQKGTVTQGKNFSETTAIYQDCHIAMDINELIIITKDNDFIIQNYREACLGPLVQSINRINRGLLNYKAVILFADIENKEEMKVVNRAIDELRKYNYQQKTYTLSIDDNRRKNKLVNSIIRHISDRNDCYNKCLPNTIYTFDSTNLFSENEDKRKKCDHLEIYNFYLKLKEIYPEKKDIALISLITSKFNISQLTFKRIKSKYSIH